ncbi:hypothetical protein E3J62_09695 [candidate division TA06 bacterium]|uniref:Uncharacterized protein n=1 Tax=candidate division TA06 bacterium TaxID=2250710 RepID=A0A523UQH4_UNCT6|nr:MAG: hypothetical protein E3J62_09695 [candidate division TA06 bacterium]
MLVPDCFRTASFAMTFLLLAFVWLSQRRRRSFFAAV